MPQTNASLRARSRACLCAGLLLGLVWPAGCAEDEDKNPYAPGESGFAPPLDDTGDFGDEGGYPDLPSDDSGGDSTTGGWDGGDEDSGDDGGGSSTGTTTTTGGGGQCTQPLSGMFAHCLAPEECGGLSCFQVKQDEQVLNGFCTVACSNANECGPAPGNCSSTPACVPVGGQYACALSCAGGASCPPGMECMNFQDSGEVCV
jgi:hypothetical protein